MFDGPITQVSAALSLGRGVGRQLAGSGTGALYLGEARPPLQAVTIGKALDLIEA